jgi:hypothetical protein
LDQVKSASPSGLRADPLRSALSLGKIARSTDHFRAVRRQCARGLDPEARGNACDEHPLSAQIDASQHLIGRRCGSKRIGHGQILAVFRPALPLHHVKMV